MSKRQDPSGLLEILSKSQNLNNVPLSVACGPSAAGGYGRPEIFNTDQGCQFTSEAFTSVLTAQGISVSMDGRGRALDNIFVERLWRSVKYEDIYLKSYASVTALTLGLTEYFKFYNTERMHQSLGNSTPINVYRTASGGGAMIVDKFSVEEKPESKTVADSGQRRAAARPATILNPVPFCLD